METKLEQVQSEAALSSRLWNIISQGLSNLEIHVESGIYFFIVFLSFIIIALRIIQHGRKQQERQFKLVQKGKAIDEEEFGMLKTQAILSPIVKGNDENDLWHSTKLSVLRIFLILSKYFQRI